MPLYIPEGYRNILGSLENTEKAIKAVKEEVKEEKKAVKKTTKAAPKKK